MRVTVGIEWRSGEMNAPSVLLASERSAYSATKPTASVAAERVIAAAARQASAGSVA